MHKWLKTLHLVGFALTFGGLTAQLIGASALGAKITLLVGFWVLTLSGIAFIIRSKGALLRSRWLRWHLGFGMLGAIPAVIAVDHQLGTGFIHTFHGKAVMSAVIGSVKPSGKKAVGSKPASYQPQTISSAHSDAVRTARFSKPFLYGISVIAVFTLFITTFMDVNSSHMTNPLWPPHARFHWAAQYFGTLTASCVSLFMLWGRYREKGGRLSVLVAGLSPLFFWGMFVPALLMPGTSTMPDGFVVPEGFPKLFTVLHPNFLISCVINIVSVWLTAREWRRSSLSD